MLVCLGLLWCLHLVSLRVVRLAVLQQAAGIEETQCKHKGKPKHQQLPTKQIHPTCSCTYHKYINAMARLTFRFMYQWRSLASEHGGLQQHVLAAYFLPHKPLIAMATKTWTTHRAQCTHLPWEFSSGWSLGLVVFVHFVFKKGWGGNCKANATKSTPKDTANQKQPMQRKTNETLNTNNQWMQVANHYLRHCGLSKCLCNSAQMVLMATP